MDRRLFCILGVNGASNVVGLLLDIDDNDDDNDEAI
jgi:hypothetical protein